MRILMMAGGTGGHVFPALAVAEALRDLGHTVSWLGTADKLEAHCIPTAGFEIDFLTIRGVRKNGLRGWLGLPIRLFCAVYKASRVIRQRKPDLVIGMGGYASGPGGIAAWLSRVPLIIHEQNAVAGLTNRCLAKIARVRLAAFNAALGPKTIVIGNPLRAEFLQKQKPDALVFPNRPLRLLVVGGSLGAKILNEIVPAALKKLPNNTAIDIRHQAGQTTLDLAKKSYQGLPLNYQVSAFIKDMAAAYHWADLVICRAGALTVSELAVMGKPAIFVPLPHAVDDHQYQNAQPLVQTGAALCFRQTDFTAEALAEAITTLLAQPKKLADMAHNMSKYAAPHATLDCVQYIVSTKNWTLDKS